MEEEEFRRKYSRLSELLDIQGITVEEFCKLEHRRSSDEEFASQFLNIRPEAINPYNDLTAADLEGCEDVPVTIDAPFGLGIISPPNSPPEDPKPS